MNLLQEHYPKIAFVGDVMFDRNIKPLVSTDLFSEVNHIFKTTDANFCNLETPITTQPPAYPDKTTFVYPEIPNNFPFDIVNIANNHIFDCGRLGFNVTVSNLALNNISIVGQPNMSIAIKTLSGKRFGFMGFASDKFDTALPEEYKHFGITFSYLKYKKMYNLLKNEMNCDYIIVSMHWGFEYKPEDEIQKDLAQWLIDNGTDVVIGHHPHIQQKIERYNNGLIAYSLGNFLFQHIKFDTPETRKGKILIIEFDKYLSYSEIDTVCEGPNYKIKIV